MDPWDLKEIPDLPDARDQQEEMDLMENLAQLDLKETVVPQVDPVDKVFPVPQELKVRDGFRLRIYKKKSRKQRS